MQTTSIPSAWPKYSRYQKRFFVPDFDASHPFIKKTQLLKKPKFIFIAESPHVSEVEPLKQEERRPLCGKAGREWWKMLGKILNPKAELSEDCSPERMLKLAEQGDFVILNAVPFPLDSGITKHYGEESDPIYNLGFCKVDAEFSYKKQKASKQMDEALQFLRERILKDCGPHTKIVCLGLDSKWFVEKALSREPDFVLPHPSAWWRRGGFFRNKSEGMLRDFFSASAK